jgi:hypothetical protein
MPVYIHWASQRWSAGRARLRYYVEAAVARHRQPSFFIKVFAAAGARAASHPCYRKKCIHRAAAGRSAPEVRPRWHH